MFNIIDDRDKEFFMKACRFNVPLAGIGILFFGLLIFSVCFTGVCWATEDKVDCDIQSRGDGSSNPDDLAGFFVPPWV